MIFQTLLRAVNIIKFEKNSYQEIIHDKNSIYGSGLIIILAALVNVGLFKIYLLPNLPNEVPLYYIFFLWIFFNWFVFSYVILFIVKLSSSDQNLNNKKIALSFIGFSNTAEILKIFIIFFPNLIILISWGALMLVIASQVVGVKQIYNLKSTFSAVGVVIGSYIAQFILIGLIVITLIKLAF
mgnify:CR=1 FL=1|tara:strand:- start:449 stop:997 length:549 start_codon:yes stop_codon:yes gene_type:complete